ERIKLQEQEFFASRLPEIANAPNKAARDRLIKKLEKAPPGTGERALFDAFTEAKREAEATSEFVRVPGQDGGRFALTGRGDVNTYALFAELFANLAWQRAGVIVPTGIATDATTAPFFAHLVEARRLARLVDFENRAGLFPAVDSRMKFVLLTLGQDEPAAHFAFFLTEPAQLAEPERNFTLTPADIAAINPNTKTAPVFRSRADAELTAKMYGTVPVLINEEKGDAGNQWGFNYMTKMFDMADSSHLFRTAEQLSQLGFVKRGTDWLSPPQLPPERLVPLFEAKMAHQFDHRWSGYNANGESLEFGEAEQRSPEFEPSPRYWISAALRDERTLTMRWQHRWLTGWRDIARATDERTLIASIVPDVAVNHKIRLFFLPATPNVHVSFTASLNSLVVDYLVRQKVSATTLAVFMLAQLPILPPTFYTEPRLAFIAPKVLELTYTSHSLAPFARDLGHDGPPFTWDEDRRALLRADLDAFYARAYGLTRDELRYILDPADVKGPDYPSETFRVLKEKEIRQHGEYRTRRLVLEAWDRMEENGVFASLGMADTASAAVRQVQLHGPDEYQDGVWAWPHGLNERDRVRAQLRAIVGTLPGPSDSRRIRLAALACLQPGLLDGFLSGGDRQEWQRLTVHSKGVSQLVPPTNTAWGVAFSELVSSAVLDVSSDGSQWSAGSKLDRSTLDANDPHVGRAIFAWSRLEHVDLDQGLAQVSAVILPFIREGRLAA
ncbi:MAG: restriction endonuclease, partial [Devosia sp.]